mmetsp:Transcript_17053/g.50841  ORF Transcript_17053/g.50841 Transcript_17053/m.50841 type:complete len:312 (-) Transcript_17053:66-1001(-)
MRFAALSAVLCRPAPQHRPWALLRCGFRRCRSREGRRARGRGVAGAAGRQGQRGLPAGSLPLRAGADASGRRRGDCVGAGHFDDRREQRRQHACRRQQHACRLWRRAVHPGEGRGLRRRTHAGGTLQGGAVARFRRRARHAGEAIARRLRQRPLHAGEAAAGVGLHPPVRPARPGGAVAVGAAGPPLRHDAGRGGSGEVPGFVRALQGALPAAEAARQLGVEGPGRRRARGPRAMGAPRAPRGQAADWRPGTAGRFRRRFRRRHGRVLEGFRRGVSRGWESHASSHCAGQPFAGAVLAVRRHASEPSRLDA